MRLPLIATSLLMPLLGSGCHMLPDMDDLVILPEAHTRNLEQLHRADGSYSYNGILLGDFGYLAEIITGRDRSSYLSPSYIPSPSGETLDNLGALLGAEGDELRVTGQRIQWSARLVHADPSELVRERAALGLGQEARRAGVTEMIPAPDPAEIVGPEAVGGAIEDLLRTLRLSREDGEAKGQVGEACASAAALKLDIDGAWRLHKVTLDLLGTSLDAESEVALLGLGKQLQERMITVGIAAALQDPSDIVVLAGLRGLIQVSGYRAALPFLANPNPSLSDELLLGMLDLLGETGFPSEGIPAQLRSACIRSMLTLAVEHPSQRVRVRSMLVLQFVVPEGPRSLREEDWHRWRAALSPVVDGAA